MKPQTWALPALDLAALDAFIQGCRLQSDNRKIQPGDIFLAFQREYSDGRDFIEDALSRGAAGIIWEAEGFSWNPAWMVPQMSVAQLRFQAGMIIARSLGEPSRNMKVIGVTGTNGKTSITNWLGQVLSELGHRVGLLGTVGNGFYGHLESSTHTTHDPATLQQWHVHFRDGGASHVAMEVSSHGLAQARAHGVVFELAIFTNLTRDHLDYHGSMEVYGAEKAKLFAWEGLKTAVINADDAFGKKLLKSSSAARVLSYGIDDGDVRAVKVTTSLEGLCLEVDTPQGRAVLKSVLVGRFNVYNLLAVLASLLALDVKLADAIRVLEKVVPAPGRMQCLGGGNKPLVVVDYAHTPDALEKALLALCEILPAGSQLHCVFGCGGDRDPGKRPLMGEIASRLADKVILTSDNPRSEEPQAILEAIAAGIKTGHYKIEPDRAKAIAMAVAGAELHDVVLVAGKGHEAYQEIKGVQRHFDDVEEIAQALRIWGNKK